MIKFLDELFFYIQIISGDKMKMKLKMMPIQLVTSNEIRKLTDFI